MLVVIKTARKTHHETHMEVQQREQKRRQRLRLHFDVVAAGLTVCIPPRLTVSLLPLLLLFAVVVPFMSLLLEEFLLRLPLLSSSSNTAAAAADVGFARCIRKPMPNGRNRRCLLLHNTRSHKQASGEPGPSRTLLGNSLLGPVFSLLCVANRVGR